MVVVSAAGMLHHDVVKTLSAVALLAWYVIGVVESTSNCAVGEYYDQLIEECRSCRLICLPHYGTRELCADKCSAATVITVAATTTSKYLLSAVYSYRKRNA